MQRPPCPPEQVGVHPDGDGGLCVVFRLDVEVIEAMNVAQE